VSPFVSMQMEHISSSGTLRKEQMVNCRRGWVVLVVAAGSTAIHRTGNPLSALGTSLISPVMTDVNRRVVEKIMLLTFSNSPYTTTAGSADGASASTEEEGTALQRSGNPPTLRLLLARCIWWCMSVYYLHIYVFRCFRGVFFNTRVSGVLDDEIKTTWHWKKCWMIAGVCIFKYMVLFYWISFIYILTPWSRIHDQEELHACCRCQIDNLILHFFFNPVDVSIQYNACYTYHWRALDIE
jgi:hypothetical protein